MRTHYQQGSWKDELGFTNSQAFKGQNTIISDKEGFYHWALLNQSSFI